MKKSGIAGARIPAPHSVIIVSVAIAVPLAGNSTNLGTGSDTSVTKISVLIAEITEVILSIDITSNTTLDNLTNLSVSGITS